MAARAILERFASVVLVASVALALGGVSDARAHSYEKGAIKIGHLWLPPRADAIRVYGPIVNDGDAAIRLVEASSPIAGAVRLERGEGDARSTLEAIEVPAGGVYPMAAWRGHLRLVDVSERPVPGEAFPLILRFASGTTMEVTVVVESAAGH